MTIAFKAPCTLTATIGQYVNSQFQHFCVFFDDFLIVSWKIGCKITAIFQTRQIYRQLIFGLKFLIHKVYKKVCDRYSPAKVQPSTAIYLRSKKKIKGERSFWNFLELISHAVLRFVCASLQIQIVYSTRSNSIFSSSTNGRDATCSVFTKNLRKDWFSTFS